MGSTKSKCETHKSQGLVRCVTVPPKAQIQDKVAKSFPAFSSSQKKKKAIFLQYFTSQLNIFSFFSSLDVDNGDLG